MDFIDNFNMRSGTINTLKSDALVIANAFQKDTLYKSLITDDDKRKGALPIFFESYMGMFPEAKFLYSTENKESIAFIFVPNAKINKIESFKAKAKGMLKLLTMIKVLNIKELYSFLNGIHNNSSVWIENHIKGDFIHIDLIVTKEKHKGMGYASEIIKKVIDIADELKVPITLETQNIDNIKYYEKFGFEIVEKQKYKEIIQYDMIRYKKL